MLSVLSSQQIGIRGALQDCARWNLRTGVAWRHEVLYAQYSSIRDKNRSTKSEQHMFVSWRHELNNISSSGHYWLQIDQSKCVCKSGSTSLFSYISLFNDTFQLHVCLSVALMARWSTCPNWSRSKLTCCKTAMSSILYTGKVSQNKVSCSFFIYAMRLRLYEFIRRNDWQYHLSLVTL